MNWKMRLALRRNAVLGSARFQRWASHWPIVRSVARYRAARQFDLIAGFVYTQVTQVYVTTGLLAALRERVMRLDEVQGLTGLSEAAALRLLRAGEGIGLSESAQEGVWTLGRTGAELSANDGAMAMVAHHALLYRDLANPLELLRRAPGEGTALSAFWTYAMPGGAEQSAQPYSQLMAATQPMVWQQVIGHYRFDSHRRMLDVGGGSGGFVEAIGTHATGLKLGIFDLPEVVMLARNRVAGTALEPRVALHPGSFRTDPIPTGYDLVTLVRILHDHDDDVAQALLGSIFESLPSGGKLLIIEPMARTRGAKAMGDSYFGLYLWAMGSGRPRPFAEIAGMARKAGFARVVEIDTPLPIIARALLARKAS
ncbi:methyltransferase [Erythrobacter sp. SDW2]|uniref:methyltransferase n=1 Tax=Erythrobacter sp. SDW2 TaxID=2907154 RepID=UPI001F24185D|nr:methyltransferase [Erythrobacter sp. SDW2]UIP06909.1 methyltransferase [Erythrobacter sp. SDW2]